MKTLEEYMNDPAIADEPEYLREIHAIRFKIQDEQKGMTTSEICQAVREKALKISQEYHIPLVWADLTPVTPVSAAGKK